jgi:hypothetical protein
MDVTTTCRYNLEQVHFSDVDGEWVWEKWQQIQVWCIIHNPQTLGSLFFTNHSTQRIKSICLRTHTYTMAPVKGNQAGPGSSLPGNIKSFVQTVRECTPTSFPTTTFTESTLVNALTFDFWAYKGSLSDLIKQVDAHYTGQIASLVKQSTLKCV